MNDYKGDNRKGRIETLIVGTPPVDNEYKDIIPSVMNMEIPLPFPKGYHYGLSVDMGTYETHIPPFDECLFKDAGQPQYIDIYPEYEPYYYYTRYPDGKPGEISLTEYENNFNPYKGKKDIVYEFTLKMPESAVSTKQIPTTKTYIDSNASLILIDSKNNLLNSFEPTNGDTMETVLKPGKYRIISEVVEPENFIHLFGEFHEFISDNGSDEGNGEENNNRDGEIEPDDNIYGGQGSISYRLLKRD